MHSFVLEFEYLRDPLGTRGSDQRHILMTVNKCVALMMAPALNSTLAERACKMPTTKFQKRERMLRSPGLPEWGLGKVSPSQLGPLQETGKYGVLTSVMLTVFGSKAESAGDDQLPDQSTS